MEDLSGLITPDDPRSHRQRLLDGDPFFGPADELLEDQRRAARLVQAYTEALEQGFEAAQPVLDELFKEATFCFLKPPLTVNYGYPTTIGPGTFLNSGAVLLDDGGLTIGSNVLAGPNVQFLTAYHPLDAAERRKAISLAKPIVIGDDVWIGAGAIILAGVTVGERSVIGAGSVVTKDVPSDCVAVGNPARVVRQLDDSSP